MNSFYPLDLEMTTHYWQKVKAAIIGFLGRKVTGKGLLPRSNEIIGLSLTKDHIYMYALSVSLQVYGVFVGRG